MICFAKLPVDIPVTNIQDEVMSITESWHPHLNTFDYQGGWEVLSLRSPGGSSSTIIPDIINGSVFMDTSLMDKCPSIKKITEHLHCPVMAVRLLNLKGGAKIKPHKDYELISREWVRDIVSLKNGSVNSIPLKYFHVHLNPSFSEYSFIGYQLFKG